MHTLNLKTLTYLAFTLLVSAAEDQKPIQSPSSWKIGQEVKTSSGDIQGHESKFIPGVSEYLGIPFGVPPVGPLRFAAPQKYEAEGKKFVADKYGPDCPAAITIGAGIRDPDSQIGTLMNNSLSGNGHEVSEDCLSVNVWTTGKSNDDVRGKAVLLWIYGGGFQLGTANTKIYDGARLADEQDVVVVTFNYRTNIFGFPSAPGLPDYNPGLLDQRLALQWVRTNIFSFGGDPSRITLFGQSAGGCSVDFHAYAWPDDPIAHAFIPQSGAASLMSKEADKAAANWYRVSKEVGCGGEEEGGEKTLSCMRGKEWKEVVEKIGMGHDIDDMITKGFPPVVDNKTVFGDYQALGEAGKFAKKPLLIGVTNNEAGFTSALSKLRTGHRLSSIRIALINKIFECPVSFASRDRASHNVSTWRFRYLGDYPNVRIDAEAGAYHSADIFMVFGTSELVSEKEDTESQREVGRLMRRAWAVFARDPEKGLERELGWKRYDVNGKTLIRLGYKDETEASFSKSTEFDTGCDVGRTAMRYLGSLADMWNGKSGKTESNKAEL